MRAEQVKEVMNEAERRTNNEIKAKGLKLNNEETLKLFGEHFNKLKVIVEAGQ